jgi:MoaA/NifB/PqqE/SkfB family radical SAM enzyme
MKLSKPIRIFGHRPDLSFRTEAGKDFFKKEFRLQVYSFLPFVVPAIHIYLNKYNFLYLQEMIAYCFRYHFKFKKKPDQYDIQSFIDNIKDDLIESYKHHIELLNKQLAGFGTQILFEDDGVNDILGAIQSKIEKSQWKDLLQRLVYVKQHSINLNDELRVLGVLLERTFIGPIDLVLDLIHVCNTNCVHCWIHSPNAGKRLSAAFKKQKMGMETFRSIVDDADRLGVNAITLLGDGEPLLHADFIDMLKYLKQKNMFMEAITFTNGFGLDHSTSRNLIDEGLNQLICSVPAATPHTYAQICTRTGERGFFKILGNLKHLHQLKQRRKIHPLIKRRLPEVTLAFVLHRLNYHEICDMASLAGEVGADNIRFQLIHLDNDNQHLRLDPDHLLFIKEHLDRARQIAETYDIILQSSLSFQLDHMNSSQGDWSENIYLEKGCYVGWSFSILKADGDLGLCCALKKLGNISAQGFRANWESDRYNSYRIGAKSLKTNADMRFQESAYQKEKDGSRLFSSHCQHCDNHDQNNYMLRLLEQSGLVNYIGH